MKEGEIQTPLDLARGTLEKMVPAPEVMKLQAMYVLCTMYYVRNCMIIIYNLYIYVYRLHKWIQTTIKVSLTDTSVYITH